MYFFKLGGYRPAVNVNGWTLVTYDFTLWLSCAVTKSAPYHLTNGELRGKTYRWLREGGMVDSWWDSSSRRRRRRNIRHEKESERERDTAAFALFIADIYWLGNLKKKRRSVCAQWQRASVRYREVFVLKRKRRPLVSDIKQPRTLAEKRPCTIPCETLLSRMCGLHFNLVA